MIAHSNAVIGRFVKSVYIPAVVSLLDPSTCLKVFIVFHFEVSIPAISSLFRNNLSEYGQFYDDLETSL